MGSSAWLTRSACDVLSTLWTERKTGRERQREERHRENSRNGTDDHRERERSKRKSLTWDTWGIFQSLQMEVWGPWGFMGILPFPFSAPKGKGSTSYNIMPG